MVTRLLVLKTLVGAEVLPESADTVSVKNQMIVSHKEICTKTIPKNCFCLSMAGQLSWHVVLSEKNQWAV